MIGLWFVIVLKHLPWGPSYLVVERTTKEKFITIERTEKEIHDERTHELQDLVRLSGTRRKEKVRVPDGEGGVKMSMKSHVSLHSPICILSEG
jgi:hypothetical protein